MEAVIAELGMTMLCLLAGGCVLGWLKYLLEYVSMLF